MPATEIVAPRPPSAPADHLACSEKPSASWRQRGGLAACGATLVFLASIHGDRGSGEKPCAAIGQGAAGRDDASPPARGDRAHTTSARGDRAHTAPAGSPPSSPPVGAVRRHVSQNGDRAARAGVLLAVTLSPPFRDRRRPRHRRRQHRLAPRASPSPPPPPALDLATASFWGSAGGLPASPPPPLSSSATASARSVSRRPPRALTATVGRSSPPPRRRCLIWAGSGAGTGSRVHGVLSEVPVIKSE